MYLKLQEFLWRHVTHIERGLVFLILLSWPISAFWPPLNEVIVASPLGTALIVVLLFEILKEVRPIRGQEIFASQEDAMPGLIALVNRERPKTADLIEYSGSTVSDLLQELKKGGARVRLLICHPDAAISDLQRQRINASIANLRHVVFVDYDRAEIRCYREPASLRGRNLGGKVVNVGWYTYSSEEPVRIWGHKNPMVVADVDTVSGRCLENMFNRTFEALWNDNGTTPLSQVLDASDK